MVSSTLDFLMSKSCGEQIISEFSIVMTEETLKVVLSFPMKIFQSRLVILGYPKFFANTGICKINSKFWF